MYTFIQGISVHKTYDRGSKVILRLTRNRNRALLRCALASRDMHLLLRYATTSFLFAFFFLLFLHMLRHHRRQQTKNDNKCFVQKKEHSASIISKGYLIILLFLHMLRHHRRQQTKNDNKCFVQKKEHSASIISKGYLIIEFVFYSVEGSRLLKSNNSFILVEMSDLY
jgi:hypothetical protein